ncbi:uroporphyrinogen-III C-methyltransferase [Pasteurella skyensis]|uniref:uroporphyrinogen-III C-methyltransferase n=1 Tax=Phocoenobacter skyensis TaxID=97481 RepID=UPI00275D76F3|nr:uroporphyrinogen-III C-methyltransferase [Pasteurella skyensis]MDP8176436.1 uroporphyrinogen-III C-methyltransferase [Pasteurella skyensis]MDP8199051.1 uroporphyrinogen-III C-methyltransferase [Pasteurella skyensis]
MSKPNKDVKQTANQTNSVISEDKNKQAVTSEDKNKQAVTSEQKIANKDTPNTVKSPEKKDASNNHSANKKDQKASTTPPTNINQNKKVAQSQTKSADVKSKVEETKSKKVEQKEQKQPNKTVPQEPKQKSSGKGIAVLALLISLGVGGAGYYFGMQKFTDLEDRIANVAQKFTQTNVSSEAATSIDMENLSQIQADIEQKIKSEVQNQVQPIMQEMEKIQATASNSSESNTSEAGATVESGTTEAVSNLAIPNFEQEKAEIAKLAENYQHSQTKLAQLEQTQDVYTQQINQLQAQVQKIGNAPQARSAVTVISDADFLLNSAQRKMLLDNDIGTVKLLLKDADQVLSEMKNPQVLKVRNAIQADLKQLASINEIDQDAIMLRLTHLATSVDDMPMLASHTAESTTTDVSDSIKDWQKNLEKSADTFLSKFIRIDDKNSAAQKVFVSPSQEAYLRENIRLRLQIATLAVPRQQNTLYKESLDAVASWVRSYFDVDNDNVKTFLTEIDNLAGQSIYIDAPQQLSSLNLLNSLRTQEVPKAPQPQVEAQ